MPTSEHQGGESATAEPDSGNIKQHDYYARTADSYDALQIDPADEHAIALAWMAALIEQRGYLSVLDVGSGTGRALLYLKERARVRVVGIEPSAALRSKGHDKGLLKYELLEGNALALPYQNDSFDLVCAYGVLHHIADHRLAVGEMTRVAKRAVFISDANNFGQGSTVNRLLKQVLNTMGLWGLFDTLRTKGKGYHYSEGDGVFYSYSLLGDVPVIRRKFPDTLYMSTRPSGPNFYRSAQTIALFATKPQN